MHELKFTLTGKVATPPYCKKCGDEPYLTQRSADDSGEDGSEIWTFECHCGHTMQFREAPRRFRESEPRDRINCGMSTYGPLRHSATSRNFGRNRAIADILKTAPTKPDL